MIPGNPTARALLVLELIQASPGITAARLARRLEVSERAARRYVGTLREAGIPIDSTRGPYGGYRVGRGLRLPPLMFRSAARPAVDITASLVQACSERRRVRLGCRSEAGTERTSDVDPWAIVVRHGRWYLL